MPVIETKSFTITFESTLSPMGLRELARLLDTVGATNNSASYGIALESLAAGIRDTADRVDGIS